MLIHIISNRRLNGQIHFNSQNTFNDLHLIVVFGNLADLMFLDLPAAFDTEILLLRFKQIAGIKEHWARSSHS